MKLLTIAAALFLLGTAAQASTYDYVCKERGRKHPLTLDDTQNTLTWKGTVYKTTTTECGRYGWHAEKDGVGFDFCTATKGVADFELNGQTILCDMKR